MKKGDTCWIIENGRTISAAEIVTVSGNLCLIKLESGKALRIPKHRLYKTFEDADKEVSKHRKKSFRSPYDY